MEALSPNPRIETFVGRKVRGGGLTRIAGMQEVGRRDAGHGVGVGLEVSHGVGRAAQVAAALVVVVASTSGPIEQGAAAGGTARRVEGQRGG